MKLSELQIISYLHRHHHCLTLAECLRGGSPGLSIYICLLLTICTHGHYPIGSCRPQVYKPPFPVFFSQFLDFSPYEQYILVHDESSLCFHGLTDLSIQKQRKTQASWVSATDSYGEKITSCPQAAFRATAMTSCANNLLALNRRHAWINCIYFLQFYTL